MIQSIENKRQVLTWRFCSQSKEEIIEEPQIASDEKTVRDSNSRTVRVPCYMYKINVCFRIGSISGQAPGCGGLSLYYSSHAEWQSALILFFYSLLIEAARFWTPY